MSDTEWQRFLTEVVTPRFPQGLTVLEANACGVPAVASDVPGLRDSVRHDRSGLLVPHADVEAYAGAIVRLLREQETWRRLRAGALSWAAEFTWDNVTDRIEALITGAVSAASAAGDRGGGAPARAPGGEELTRAPSAEGVGREPGGEDVAR